MIQYLELEQFTVFQHVRFEFGKHINVFHGENGTGKTHVLKAMYSVMRALTPGPRDRANGEVHVDERLLRAQNDKLLGVFKAGGLNGLVSLGGARSGTAAVKMQVGGKDNVIDYRIRALASQTTTSELTTSPGLRLTAPSVFLPTRELLSVYTGFVSLYDNVAVPFEETWRDTCSLLGRPLLRGEAQASIQALLEPIEAELGGRVTLNAGDQMVIERPDGSSVPAHMEAEGRRKLAMLARLIANGSISAESALFWDEPESNLNPAIIKKLAAILFSLSRHGVQIFLATHSLFLMREIHVLQGYATEKLDIRYFGLHRTAAGVTVDQGPDIADSGDVAALDEELLQSERYMDLAMGLPAPKPASEAT